MGDLVQRPVADKKKINSNDDFELCYIRHQYLRRTGYNPSPAEMQPFKRIVDHQAKNTFFTYRNLFALVGMESEDIANIGLVHLTSFLGLFSMDRATEEKYNVAWDRIKEYNKGVIPNSNDIKNKDKANFTLFLQQRMEDLVRVCRQKARNVKGFPTEEYQVFYAPKRPPRNLRNLFEDHQKYGFRKMDMSIFKSFRRKLRKKPKGNVFKSGENWYVIIPLEQKNMTLFDLTTADMDPYDNVHNMNPEQILFHKQDEQQWEDKKVEFYSKPNKDKIDVLQKFIKKNKNKEEFKDELKAARKVLRSLGV